MKHRALVISLLSGAAAVVASHFYLERLEAEISGGPPVAVLVAATNVTPGQPLTENALAVRDLPQAYVEERHIRASDVKEVLGARPTVAVRANETLLWTDLSRFAGRARTLSDVVPSGMRAVAIEQGNADFDGLLRPGDRVDVLLTATRRPDGDATTITLLQNVLVLSIGSDIGGDADQPGVEPARATYGGSVTVSVGAEQAQLLVQAKQHGRLSLIVRSPEDIALTESMPETRAADVLGARDPSASRPSITPQRGIDHVR